MTPDETLALCWAIWVLGAALIFLGGYGLGRRLGRAEGTHAALAWVRRRLGGEG